MSSKNSIAFVLIGILMVGFTFAVATGSGNEEEPAPACQSACGENCKVACDPNAECDPADCDEAAECCCCVRCPKGKDAAECRLTRSADAE